MKVLVIGGTGTIGKAVVELLQKDHDILTVGYSDGEYHVDIASKESIQTLFDKVGKVDAVISTTGLANFGKFNELTDADYALGLNNKLMGQVNLVRIGQHFLKQGGSITLTIGILAKEPIPGSTVVSLANGGLEGFIRPASLELQGIRINAVSPPFVKETMEMMGMDSSAGMPVAQVAKTYKAVLEGEFNGEILDARKFFLNSPENTKWGRFKNLGALSSLPLTCRGACMMAQPLDPKALITIEDLAISSMWETSALVEVLELRHVESGTAACLRE